MQSLARRSPILRWVPAVAWAGVIFWFSAQPNLRISSDVSLDFVLRKLAHATVFGALSVLVMFGMGWRWTARHMFIAFALSALYAASDEFHQSFVASRHPAMTDVGIDVSGAAAALAVVGMITRRRRWGPTAAATR